MKGFEEIYTKYFHDVYCYLLGLTANEDLAEEITEETFFKTLRSIDKFEERCDIRVWLCQIAKNSYFTQLKKKKKFLGESDLSTMEAAEDSIEKLLIDKEMAFQLHQVLHNLNEPYKEVFSLRVFGDLPFKKIGLLFEKSEHWACITYHRAKEKIQKDWRNNNEQ